TCALPIFFHAIDFYQSSYGSGAMLTHLLPISGRKLFWTKLLYAVLITILTGIVSLAIILLQVRLGMPAVDLNLTEAYTELQQIFTTPGICAAIVFFAIWMLLVPLVSMFPSVVIGSGGWARRLSFGGPIIVFMGYYLVMQLVGVASLFMPPVYDFFYRPGTNGELVARHSNKRPEPSNAVSNFWFPISCPGGATYLGE